MSDAPSIIILSRSAVCQYSKFVFVMSKDVEGPGTSSACFP